MGLPVASTRCNSSKREYAGCEGSRVILPAFLLSLDKYNSLSRTRAASAEALGTPLCSHALTYMCNPSKGIPADITRIGDVATRKYKSNCGEDNGSFCCSVSALCVMCYLLLFVPYIHYGNWQA